MSTCYDQQVPIKYAATFSDPKSVSSWQIRHKKDFGSLQSVVLVVMNRVPPTLSLTHSFLKEVEGLVTEGLPLVAAAISKQVSAERNVAAPLYSWASLVMSGIRDCS